ncbi:MAG: lysozyme inhibitor LprI family protein [bacterium]|nr:lysozyme inhibitor LprI family protein [bacterium]
MGFVYKKITFVFFFLFSLWVFPCFAVDEISGNDICKKEEVSTFIKFLETAVCDVKTDNEKWLDECLQHAGNCYASSSKICFGTQIKACNEVLEIVYQKALDRANQKECDVGNKEEYCEEKRLRVSQSYWQKFVEFNCKIDVDFRGSISGIKYYKCQLNEIKNRIKQLQKFY